MSIYDFVYLLNDDGITVAIWDSTAEDEVFCGEAREASWDYGEYEIWGIDIDTTDRRGVSVILNIETGED